MAIDVIRCDAGLTAVQEFAEYDSACRQLNVGRLVDDARTLPAQLQGKWGQVLCRLLHHQLSHTLASGKKDKIKFLIQKILILLPSAGHHRNVFFRKAYFNDIPDHGSGLRRVSARLHHRRIARCNRINQRLHGKEKRIVPRAHNQHRSQWGRLHKASGTKLCQRRPHVLLLGKVPHIPNHVGNLVVHHADFTHKALVGALSQICL